jgi:UDP-glucuronate decarboxylase
VKAAGVAIPSPQDAQSIIDRDVADILARLSSRLASLSGATILVTGASGMFGGYLADVAAALGSSGLLDRSPTIYLATRKAPHPGDRLGHLIEREDVRFVVGDALGGGSLPDRVDVVIHAASPASPRDYVADPVGTLDASSRYLRALLELARSSRAAAFLYISSSEVYGNPSADAVPTPETYIGAVDPLAARAVYAEAKRFGESLCMAYHRQHGVPIGIVRPFHVHGPGLRLDDGRIVAELIAAGLRGEPFTLASDGSATRCYGYVADATVAAYAALLHGSGETFNIGVDAPETTILELATLVSELAGTASPRPTSTAVPAHLAGAPARSRPDLSKARTMLGYAPTVALEDGLRRTLAWHRAIAGTRAS